MSYVKRLLENIASLKSPNTSLEIEVKYLIDPRGSHPGFVKKNMSEAAAVDFAKHLVDSFKNTGSRFLIEETINFIEVGPTNIIKQLVFQNGVQVKNKKKYYTKKPLTNPVYLTHSNGENVDPPIKFSISEEKPISETNVKSDLVRSKLRLSIFPSDTFQDLKNWRIDLTLTKTLKKITSVSEIAQIRDVLFPTALTFDNFNAIAPWKFADSIELEIESLEPGAVTEETLAAMFTSVRRLIKVSTTEPQGVDNIQIKFYDLAVILVPHIAHTFKPPNTRGFKSLTNSVVELTKHMFFSDLKPRIENFLITDKADGFRSIIHLFPRDETANVITANSFKTMKIPKSDLGECIADSEMIEGEEGAKFLVFDVMMYDGKRVSGNDFNIRKELVSKIAELSPNIFAKVFVECPPNGDLYQTVIALHNYPKPFPYTTDGVIFTEKTGDYNKTVNYKWKSSEDTTIDFLIKECPKSLLGIDPYITRDGTSLYILCSGIDRDVLYRINLHPIKKYKEMFANMGDSKKQYIPIQFSPSSKPYAYLFWHERKDLNNKIAELHYDVKKDSWRLHKIRDDKTRDAEHGIAYGNDFRVAELVWQNYFNPITIEDFKMTKDEGLANVYFKQHDVEAYRAMRSYNSFVKETLYKPYQGISWAIDLGSGKGQDLFRYIRAGIQNVLFIDLDIMALSELINRKYSFATEKPKSFRKKDHRTQEPSSRININILEIDLNTDYKTTTDIIKKKGYSVPSGGVPLIFCNFAIHYFVGTEAMRANFVNLIKSLIAPGGRFIFTTFDGEKVFNLINGADGKWDRMEEGKLKYSLRAEYQSATFTGNNQKIKVLQPFSEDTYYSEYLVNHTILQKAFKSVGMNQEIFESFDIYQKSFKDHNQSVNDQLSDLDKQYSSLYTVSSYYAPLTPG